MCVYVCLCTFMQPCTTDLGHPCACRHPTCIIILDGHSLQAAGGCVVPDKHAELHAVVPAYYCVAVDNITPPPSMICCLCCLLTSCACPPPPPPSLS